MLLYKTKSKSNHNNNFILTQRNRRLEMSGRNRKISKEHLILFNIKEYVTST